MKCNWCNIKTKPINNEYRQCPKCGTVTKPLVIGEVGKKK